MKFVSWNVNGLRALARKEQLPWDVLPDVDVYGLQETKAHPGQLPPELAEPGGLHAFWHPARKKGYSGTAIFTRRAPDEVIEGLGVKKYDEEGRVLSVRFGDCVITSAYFPNSQEEGRRLDYKLGFCRAMERFLKRQLEAGHQTVVMGDYNIAHRPIDLARPRQNEKNPGYLPEERAWMERYLERLGYRDPFRERHPDLEGAYTWWSFRSGARARNVGWRIDYSTVSPDLVERLGEVGHHPEITGSDHCPIFLELDV